MTELPQSNYELIMHFGDMGSRWGFNRTVGQIFALLFVSPEPIHAEHIAAALRISRSNVSMSLKELQAWKLIQIKHRPQDRKEYFAVAGTVWVMAKAVLEQRVQRELAPTVTLLKQHLSTVEAEQQHRSLREQTEQLLTLLQWVQQLADQVQQLEPSQIESFVKLVRRVSKMLAFKNKVVFK